MTFRAEHLNTKPRSPERALLTEVVKTALQDLSLHKSSPTRHDFYENYIRAREFILYDGTEPFSIRWILTHLSDLYTPEATLTRLRQIFSHTLPPFVSDPRPVWRPGYVPKMLTDRTDAHV